MEATANRETIATAMGSIPHTWAQWINVGLGIAILVTMPFIANASGITKTSDIVTGAVVIIISLISFFSSGTEKGPAISWINVLAGIWLLISILFARDPMQVWMDIVYGILTIVTAVVVMGLHTMHVHLRRA